MARRRGTASRYSHSAARRRTSRKLTKREQENIAKAFFWIFFGWWLILFKLMFWDLPVAIIKAVKKKNRPQQTANNANINDITQNAYNPPSISKAQPQNKNKIKYEVFFILIVFGVFVFIIWSVINYGTPSSRMSPNTIPTASDLAIISEMVSEEPSKDISVEEIVESAEKPVESEEESIESKEESIESKAESTEKSIVSEVSVKREASTKREPSVVSRAEQVVTPQPREFTFILNTESKVYHLYECSAAKRMKSDKKRYVTKTAATKSEAMRQIEAEGYRVCGICTR